jgi:AcrR family transcriptional regulator
MPRDSAITRDKLIRAAEHLFARHGFDVPIRDIQDRAGQRNATALQYHFGGKRELIMAILDKHALSDEQLEEFRAELNAKQADPRALVEAIVRGLTDRLATPDGRDYMRMSFQLLTQTPVRQSIVEAREHPQMVSVEAERALIRASVPGLSERLVRERAVAGISFIMLLMVDRARMMDEPDVEILSEEDFVANLVDMATAALTAPTSMAKPRRAAAR